MPGIGIGPLVSGGGSGGTQGSGYGVATGTNTYSVSLGTPITSLVAGTTVAVMFTNANNSSGTLNVDGTGAKVLKKAGQTDIIANDIVANTIYILVYDGTYWQTDITIRKYALRFSFASFGPASSNTYFFGDLADLIPNTSSVARFRIETPVAGVINRVRITGNFSAGTSQSATWQIRNVTTNTIVVLTSSFSFASAGNLPVVFTSVGLAVSVGDELEMQLVTPSWVTPPTVLRVTCHAAVDVI